MFLHESRAYDEKKYFFDNFQAFFVAFNHANACASMRLLVDIHNTCPFSDLLYIWVASATIGLPLH